MFAMVCLSPISASSEAVRILIRCGKMQENTMRSAYSNSVRSFSADLCLMRVDEPVGEFSLCRVSVLHSFIRMKPGSGRNGS